LGPKPEENQAHFSQAAETMKAFSAQKTEFYWVWSQRPLCYPKVGRLVYFGRMLDKCTSPEGVNDARKPARNVAEYPRVTATT